MVFSSMVFLGLFLPILLILYFSIRSRSGRNYLLLIFSLFFYAWGEPIWIISMIFTSLVDFTSSKLIGKLGDSKYRALPLVASVVINIGILIVFKYSGFFAEQVFNLTRITIPAWNRPMPIGISFYTFQSLSYVIDVYRRDTTIQDNYFYYLMYVSMFPQLVAGPIVRYRDVAYEIEHRRESLKGFQEGAVRFVTGLGKKILLANNAGVAANTLLQPAFNEGVLIPMGNAWLGVLFFSFQIYFDFSGYSDMAIGLGKIFGFNYKENFNFPYMSTSITDFWRRWHISLSSFFRDYVYIPLGGNRRHQYLNIFIVWFLTGLWHGASWNFIIWGLYYGIFLILEKKFYLKFLNRFAFIGHIYTLLIVLFGWLIFYSTETTALINISSSFFNINSGLFNIDINGRTLLMENIWILMIYIITSTSIPSAIGNRIRKTPFKVIAEALFIIIIFSLSVIIMIGQTYNPFLYFRF